MISIDPVALGKTAVLMGGSSAEREVSLMSGGGVLAALQAAGVDAHAFDPSERDLGELKRDGFARCFIALHGRHGEDGTVQGALELLGIPYTGSGVMASAIAIDKVMTKRLWLAEGLSTPRYVLLGEGRHTEADVLAAVDTLGLPMIAKPMREGSSLGVFKITDRAQAQAAVLEAAKHDVDVLCEEFIEGDELTCALMGDGANAIALPVIRIVAPDGKYDYEHKYFSEDTGYLCPSGLPADEDAAIAALALAAYRSIDCRGWGRADVMVRASDRKAFLLEINTSPGMTGHSLVPIAARVSGVDYGTLCLRLLAAATLDA
ncbi:D-alanine--D-alanine ligase [soil metagenome]